MTVHRAAHVATRAISLARAEESFQLPDLKVERDHPEGRTCYAGANLDGDR